jgi:hypothetical protein
LKCVFGKFPDHHKKFSLGDFNAKVGTGDFFNLTFGDIFHEIGNDNGVRVVNSATSKDLTRKLTVF